MIDRDVAILAMINVSKGSATEEDKSIVDNMDESLFSEIYSELEELYLDSEYSIEDYYEVKGDKVSRSLPKPIDGDKTDLEDLDREERYKVEVEFEEFMREFGSDYKSPEDAYKDFIENYCSITSDRTYSDEEEYEHDLEMESLIVDEFTDFLVNYGGDYSSSDEAYDDYIRNYCNYI